ncbi:MAG TPA: 5-oxoprolinase subunit PxpA [Jatrophihabitantaceae bacterium]|jgi:UPF0271 protein|nr:5-oxoprolinase subunit PxpA [Jatrophihabitantaceae bacterium]
MPIDLNADLGEGFGVWRLGDDAGLLKVISSANVACGFHAGDPITMRRICEQAVGNGVAIGAQVGYRDLAGFGRRRIDVDAAELSAEVLYQLAALDGFARLAGDRVRYLKPHGALYNTAADDAGQAEAIIDAVAGYDPAIPVLGLPGSELAVAAGRRSITFVAEAFADRGYTARARLVPRGQAGALLTDTDDVTARGLAIARGEPITTVDGGVVSLTARSICLHGDTPGAVGLARALREALLAARIAVQPFA